MFCVDSSPMLFLKNHTGIGEELRGGVLQIQRGSKYNVFLGGMVGLGGGYGVEKAALVDCGSRLKAEGLEMARVRAGGSFRSPLLS